MVTKTVRRDAGGAGAVTSRRETVPGEACGGARGDGVVVLKFEEGEMVGALGELIQPCPSPTGWWSSSRYTNVEDAWQASKGLGITGCANTWQRGVSP
jgi:hypothetical protein